MRRFSSGLRIAAAVWIAGFFLLTFLSAGCSRAPEHQPLHQETMPRRDINDVLKDHDRELLKIPGVVGVYVGALEDGKTLCLKVMVVQKTPELEQKIPKVLEGYPVFLDETGVIRPFRKGAGPE